MARPYNRRGSPDYNRKNGKRKSKQSSPKNHKKFTSPSSRPHKNKNNRETNRSSGKLSKIKLNKNIKNIKNIKSSNNKNGESNTLHPKKEKNRKKGGEKYNETRKEVKKSRKDYKKILSYSDYSEVYSDQRNLKRDHNSSDYSMINERGINQNRPNQPTTAAASHIHNTNIKFTGNSGPHKTGYLDANNINSNNNNNNQNHTGPNKILNFTKSTKYNNHSRNTNKTKATDLTTRADSKTLNTNNYSASFMPISALAGATRFSSLQRNTFNPKMGSFNNSLFRAIFIDSSGYIITLISFILTILGLTTPLWCKPIGSPIFSLLLRKAVSDAENKAAETRRLQLEAGRSLYKNLQQSMSNSISTGLNPNNINLDSSNSNNFVNSLMNSIPSSNNFLLEISGQLRDVTNGHSTATVACLACAFLVQVVSLVIDRLEVFSCGQQDGDQHQHQNQSPISSQNGTENNNHSRHNRSNEERALNQPNPQNQLTTKFRPKSRKKYFIVSILWIIAGILNLLAVINFKIYTNQNSDRLDGAFDLFGLYEKISQIGGGTFLRCDYGPSYYFVWVSGVFQMVSGLMFLYLPIFEK